MLRVVNARTCAPIRAWHGGAEVATLCGEDVQPDDTGKEFHRLEPPSIIAVFDRMFLVVSGSRLCCWPACDCCTIVEVFD
jgi:hypothetical protein